MALYHDRLAALDHSWREYVSNGWLNLLRDRALKAGVFALCSVHTPVEQGEYEFAQYMATGVLPEGAMLDGQKARGIADLVAWLDTTTVETFAVDGWTLARTFMDNVYGLGTAKGAFASALCGNPEPFCIDTHGAQLIGDIAMVWDRRVVNSIKADKSAGCKAVDAAWRRYRAWGSHAFADRLSQWDFFANKVPDFAGHEAYFEEALWLSR